MPFTCWLPENLDQRKKSKFLKGLGFGGRMKAYNNNAFGRNFLRRAKDDLQRIKGENINKLYELPEKLASKIRLRRNPPIYGTAVLIQACCSSFQA
jgi:hypothetical protein